MIRYIVILVLISNVSCKDLGLPAGSACEWNGIPGKCVTVFQCLTVGTDITNRNYPPICSLEGKILTICCTDCELVEDTRLILRNPVLGNLFKTGNKKAKDKCTDYLDTLDYKCKEELRPLPPTKKMLDVVSNCTYEGSDPRQAIGFTPGGYQNFSREEFPHMALLGFGDTITTAEWLCGGSVISERFILTAAHCVISRNAGIVKFVALGILKRSDPPSLWQTYNVQRTIHHPGYKHPSKYHDIALLETDREILFSSRVLPACLHVDDDEELFAFGTGWGASRSQNSSADILQSVPLRKYTDEICSELYPKHRHLAGGVNTSTQMCYGNIDNQSGPTDTCWGDIGGPLQTLDSRKCVHTIVGVTSYARRYCEPFGGASLYTRVSCYIPWIEDIVWP